MKKQIPRPRINLKDRRIISAIILLFLFICAGTAAGIDHSLYLALTGDSSDKRAQTKKEVPALPDLSKIAQTEEVPPPPTDEAETEPGKPLAERTAYSPNCTGAGCVTKNPGFTIVTNGSVTVTAGSFAGPLTASTSTGVVVDWTSPSGTSLYGPEPSGYSLTGALHGSSMEYYIRAEENTPPGTYTLFISAVNAQAELKVRTSLSVTVLPKPVENSYPDASVRQ